MIEAENRQLIMRIKQGHKEAFRELVEIYKKPLYYYCFRLCRNHADAEDLSQEVFIKVYQKIEQFREEAKIQTWIYRIASNAFIDKKRRKVFVISETDSFDRDTQIDTEVMQSHESEITPDRKTESSIIQKHIDRAMQKLSDKEKTVFILKHYEGLAIKEIAAIFKTSDGTVKSHLFRAVQKLQSALAFYRSDLGLEES
ncbi:MAG: sigma-70 family RNA polymerase sigma factor [Calditrichaceae bacterium]|nr:sigma-70 family RNA polymerase sigma factor [Calditrichaceae bacterium]